MYPPPPPPPRPSHHKRALVITGVAALALGAAAGGLVNTLHTSSSGTATATSKTGLSASQIAARVDPGLVDVISTDGDVQPDGAMSYGTGIVLTATGEILTNNHVIEGATSVKVIDIGNGKTYKANVVGYDAGHDVAVLQLADASGLTIASLGDSSSVAVGNSVTALGNAEGKNGTPSVASGTVTALNQSITASDELSSTNEQLTGLIESNTPIEPGDSGGPLVNAYGQVVGMDTAASSSYQFQGVGQNQNSGATDAYTIPIGEAIQLAQDIESGNATGTIHIGATAFMGIEISTENQSDTGGLGGLGGLGGQGTGGQGSGGQGSGGQGSGGQQQGNGAELAGVLQNSPAANAGLAEGDTITALGGQSVTDSEDVQHILVKYHPGDSVPVTWVDGAGTQHTSTLKLTSGPAA
ncbi:MAG TPA: trypsin-like peptidase domain-containing protein [Streptosporangiaceae bacterium]